MNTLTVVFSLQRKNGVNFWGGLRCGRCILQGTPQWCKGGFFTWTHAAACFSSNAIECGLSGGGTTSWNRCMVLSHAHDMGKANPRVKHVWAINPLEQTTWNCHVGCVEKRSMNYLMLYRSLVVSSTSCGWPSRLLHLHWFVALQFGTGTREGLGHRHLRR